jgi:threonine/homoserine/homoserine lactone efflux protein
MLPLFILLGTTFGALGAAGAFVISYSEYRRRRLRPGQSARRMALETAAVTFIVFFVSAIVLSFIL